MKPTAHIFATCFASIAFCAAYAAQSPVNAPTPVIMGASGANLTAFTGNTGALNNNMWNAQVNPSAAVAPKADWGNCNAVIMRCAQPKCASGGCTNMDVAFAIANGCVQANAGCKSHGSALAEYIAGQLVASSNAAMMGAQQQMAMQQAAAEQAAGAAAAQQMQDMQYQMQSQMQDMQAQMAAQAQESAARMEAALEAQAAAQAAAAAAAAQPAAPQSFDNEGNYNNAGAGTAAEIAAAHGISADILVREQASGQILSKLEGVRTQLNATKAAMLDVFTYAGCDANGNNCNGPRRAAAFRQKANKFFDPYEEVLSQVYDALQQAMALGVDVTDIIMMLENSCQIWGMYMCQPGVTTLWVKRGTEEVCFPDGSDANKNCVKNPRCQLLRTLANNEEVQQNWLNPETGVSREVPCKCGEPGCTIERKTTTGSTTTTACYKIDPGANIMVGCASDALQNSRFFKGMKKEPSLDLEILRQMITADAPNFKSTRSNDPQLWQYCAVEDPAVLQQAIMTRGVLENKMCIRRGDLVHRQRTSGGEIFTSIEDACDGVWKDGHCDCHAVCTCPHGKVLAQDAITHRCVCVDADDPAFAIGGSGIPKTPSQLASCKTPPKTTSANPLPDQLQSGQNLSTALAALMNSTSTTGTSAVSLNNPNNVWFTNTQTVVDGKVTESRITLKPDVAKKLAEGQKVCGQYGFDLNTGKCIGSK